MIIWNILILALHATGEPSVLHAQKATPQTMFVQQLEAPKGALRLELKCFDREEGLAQVTIFDETYTPLRMIPVALEGEICLHTIQLQTLNPKLARYYQVSKGNQLSAITEIKD